MILPKQELPSCLSAQNTRINLLDYMAATTFYNAGTPVPHCWIVRQGYVKLYRLSSEGRQVTLSILGRGAVFGAVDLRGVAAETAVAQGTVQLYRLEAREFEALLAADREFSRFVTRSLAQRNDSLQRRLFSMLHRKVEARLAAMLYELVDCEGEPCVHGCEVDVQLTQQDLADMVGASRQVVSSVLNRLRNQGLIEYTREFMCIRDMRKLAEVAAS